MASLKIAFTSCMDATREPHQSVWESIAGHDPDVLLLLGDQIYMDWGLGKPKWPELVKTTRGLEVFAREMHMRYAQQAAVPAFRTLLVAMKNKQVLITWDDHDFAWNNSVGAGPDYRGRRRVPAEVKRISAYFFEQFRAWMLQPQNNYPRWDQSWPIPKTFVSDGVGPVTPKPQTPIPIEVLDCRWHRTLTPAEMQLAGGNTAPSVLGAAQLGRLRQLVSRKEGLCIVAGGTPLRYRYAFSDGAWSSSEGPDFPDLAVLLQSSARPVLYLSGDVHRNSWGGRLTHADKTLSHVAQVLASGAAIGRIGLKKVPASYGLLALDAAKRSGSVTLIEAGRDGQFSPRAPVRLGWTRDGWAGCPDGEANADIARGVHAIDADTDPVEFHCVRQIKDAARLVQEIPLEDLGRLDTIWRVDALVDSASMQGGSVVVENRGSSLRVKMDASALGPDVFLRAFERAIARGKKSVVLYVHGLGKSAAGAVEDAFALREAYPDAEVVLFSWPAGDGVGLLDRFLDFKPTTQRAMDLQMVGAMQLALTHFSTVARLPRFRDLAKVVLARSTGAIVLGAAVNDVDADTRLSGITRIVLSAPLSQVEDFAKRKDTLPCFGRLTQCGIAVMLNPLDQTLRAADWVDGFGTPLGLANPNDHLRHLLPQAEYFDFSNNGATGRLHNHLLPDLGPAQREVHRRALCERDLGLDSLRAQGHVTTTAYGAVRWHHVR